MSRPLTLAEIQHMFKHQTDDTRRAMIVSSVLGGAFAIVFVALRIIARKLASIPMKADDWWIFVSLVRSTLSREIQMPT